MHDIEQYWKDIGTVAKQIPNIERLAGKSIFVTGATGMVCSAIVELLLELNRSSGYGIRILCGSRNQKRLRDRLPGFVEGTDYTYIPYEATKDAVLDFDAQYVIHGASNVTNELYVKMPVETIQSNIIGMDALLRNADRLGAKRFLFVSSTMVYGRSGEVRKAEEEAGKGYLDFQDLSGSYGTAKRATEALCIAYNREYGMDVVIARLGHIYGPSSRKEDSKSVAQFARSCSRGEDIVMRSNGNLMRHYCYVMDCASAVLTILLNGKSGSAYNVASPDSVASVREMAERFAALAGTKVVFETPEARHRQSESIVEDTSMDVAKLEELGWRPCFSLESGIRRTLECMRGGL